MVDKEVVELTDEVEESSRLDLILVELKHISRILGSINQNMNKQLEPMKADIEMCKVSLNKIRKMGPGEFTVNQGNREPSPVGVPPGPQGIG